MKHVSSNRISRLLRAGVALLLTALLAFDVSLALAQRGGFRGGGGSFGGGGRSFGGSFGGSRSSGSFGGSRSSGSLGGSPRSSGGSFGGSGSVGGSSRSSGGSFGGSRSSGNSGSFGRGGAFGGGIRTTTSRPSTFGQRPVSSRTYYVNGTPYIGHSFGFWSGYSLGWAMGAPWYYHTPFSPYFYFHRPVIYQGALYPGGFNWVNFFISLLFFGFLIWLVVRIFSGGGRGKRIRYTNY